MTTWTSEQREFFQNDVIFSKRQLMPSELPFNPDNILFANERLTNEYAALRYIQTNTTIPVPPVLHFGPVENGSLKLVTGVIGGKLLEDFEDEEREDAIKAVDEQMQRHIIPELQKLQRDTIGSVDKKLPVFPPNPVMYDTMQAFWKPITSGGPAFVFCHNDLSGHNIILDPKTYDIRGIVDWEYAGFFPAWFERELWRKRFKEREEVEEDEYVKAVKDFFKDDPSS